MLGSFTEGLVNSAIRVYDEKKVAYFRKSHLSCALSNFNRVAIKDKGDVDYYGIYKEKYVCFEVKETIKDYWDISRLKEHQLEILRKVSKLGGISFLLLNFVSHSNSTFIFFSSDLERLLNRDRKRLRIHEAYEYGVKAPVLFPGYIDFLSVI